jgi:TetR/AcrR family transcriptional regulator, mexJK operon transcriptional repressor
MPAATTPQPATRTEQKRHAIVAAARTVFLRNGYLGTSMDEIAALASVSKQTLYKQFTDKETLFVEVVQGIVQDVDVETQAATRALGETDALERDLGRLARGFLGALREPHVLQLRRLIIGEAGRFPALGRAYWQYGFEHTLETLSACFQRLAERGLLRPMNDPLVAAEHFAGLVLWIPMNRVMFGGESSVTDEQLEAAADAAVRTFLAAYGERGT